MFGGFDDYDDVGEARDEAVALQKATFVVYLVVFGVFGDNGTVLVQNLFG